jgi:class 3 adenylate cyclase
LLTWLAVLGLVAAYLSQTERAERSTLMHLFASHLSEQVAQEIWRQRAIVLKGERPRPLRLTGTALFSDIVGFTTISEHLDPECLTSWLNAYMNAMSRIVLAHGGIVLQFVGDGILAVFGVPVPRIRDVEMDHDAAQAVHCALAMKRELQLLNEKWEREGLPLAAIRVGIHTGTMVASSIGARAHWEYTVVGDAVNIAARLQALPKSLTSIKFDESCCILIGGTTWDCLHGAFNGHLLGNVALKGKERLVPVYQIVTDVIDDRACS